MSNCEDRSFGNVPKDNRFTNLSINDTLASKETVTCDSEIKTVNADVLVSGQTGTMSLFIDGKEFEGKGVPGPPGPAGPQGPPGDLADIPQVLALKAADILPTPLLFNPVDPPGTTVDRYWDLGVPNVTSAWVNLPLGNLNGAPVLPPGTYRGDHVNTFNFTMQTPEVVVYVTDEFKETTRYSGHGIEQDPSGTFTLYSPIRPSRKTYTDLVNYTIGHQQISGFGNPRVSLAFSSDPSNSILAAFYIEAVFLNTPSGQNSRLVIRFVKNSQPITVPYSLGMLGTPPTNRDQPDTTIIYPMTS